VRRGRERVSVESPTLERDEPPLVIETICDHVRLCLEARGTNKTNYTQCTLCEPEAKLVSSS